MQTKRVCLIEEHSNSLDSMEFELGAVFRTATVDDLGVV